MFDSNLYVWANSSTGRKVKNAWLSLKQLIFPNLLQIRPVLNSKHGNNVVAILWQNKWTS